MYSTVRRSVCLARLNSESFIPTCTFVWCAFFDKRLPRVPVPLPPPDADAVPDLQHAVDACFALVGYDVLIDYTQPPPPATSAADLAWIEERLRATGVRPATTV